MYEVLGLKLKPIRTVLAGSLNDVVICKSVDTQGENFYTVIVIKDSGCGKKMLALIEYCTTAKDEESPYVAGFVDNKELIFVFKYYEERKLKSFMASQINLPYDKEQTCINMIMECMVSKIPLPLLMLQLENENININHNAGVYFNCFFDLSLLDTAADEKQCANKLAVIIRTILSDLPDKKLKSLKSFLLLDKKIRNNAYTSFPELYRDIKMTELPQTQTGLLKKLKTRLELGRDKIFKVLIVLCTVLAISAAIMIISRLVFGSSNLFSFRNRALEVIGTESLR